MFQSFKDRSDPKEGPARLRSLREEMRAEGLSGFIIPRSDAHQGEYVAPCDERLAWLTGFTGSAGLAVALQDDAGVFIDGRYTVQVRDQVDLDHFAPVNWPATQPGDWIAKRVSYGAKIGFDPWLHTKSDVEKITKALTDVGAELESCDNLVDRIWADRPERPAEPAFEYPVELAGKSASEKRNGIATELRDRGATAAVLTLPDSIAWLLNIRGSDIERIPVVQAFALIKDDASVQLFSDLSKFDGLDLNIEVSDWLAFQEVLAGLEGPVLVDPGSAPFAVWQVLEAAEVDVVEGRDPTVLPKACKTPAEIQGARDAHLRDAAAMVEFLAWLDLEAPKGALTEIDVVKKLEGFRASTNSLRDISFDTICGAGAHGAIVHYRVTEDTNRAVKPGELLLVDSGGQYIDGTTDITRTIAVGPVGREEKKAFTLVLQGMIAISMARFPKGLAGRDLDPLARSPLWAHGMDYDHGTGHGVGAYLSVHEGPQRISRISHDVLQPGMILSNEPGYYRQGKFGIRIENLIVVKDADELEGGDNRSMLDFETITFVPIDKNLIDVDRLNASDIAWLNSYHEVIASKLAGKLSEAAQVWLTQATAPI